ncbi:insulin-like growth factor-binding protein 5 [Astyanax mexicanus]|uniref:Insulin-like growth factor-binding protein 5 n=1 Tax=Astyanax mexicanus TaxID=7994 RepID=A0A8T2KRB4_ASTMX|nr:insulin-like growth factor-binding protein 5 [Astyanax mexicanus]
MPSLHDMLALLLTLQLYLYSCGALAPQVALRKPCPSCPGSAGVTNGHVTVPQSKEDGTAVLALGEPCGVYTLSCGRGLRCMPPDGDQSPLQALLQGRGICRTMKSTMDTPPPKEPRPPLSDSTEKGPCRKLLNSVLQGIDLTAIHLDHDIYIPNCDRHGFFRRKQCRSSRGMQRGQCWCVDERGNRAPSRHREDGSVICSST